MNAELYLKKKYFKMKSIYSNCGNISEVLLWTLKVFGVGVLAYLRGDSGNRNYPIKLKFHTNIYGLCEISCIVFAVHCPNSVCIGIQKNISIHGGKIFKINLTWLLYMKFNEIYILHSNDQ